MRPLTDNLPKPMLKILGQSLLEHILSDLPPDIDEVILVVGYLKENIINHLGNEFGNLRIRYIEQKERAGTFKALELCRDMLKDGERFLMLFADDLHGAEGLKKCVADSGYSLLVYEADDPRKFGVVEISDDGFVIEIEEKPENPRTNLVSTGVMVLDKEIFKFPAKQHENGEYYLTDSIQQMIGAGYRFRTVKSSSWLPIGYPEDLEKAEKKLKNR